MSGLHLINEGDTPEGVLKEMLACADKVEAIIVITLNKDGTQFARTSRINMYQKCFLKCFWDSWIIGWFSV